MLCRQMMLMVKASAIVSPNPKIASSPPRPYAGKAMVAPTHNTTAVNSHLKISLAGSSLRFSERQQSQRMNASPNNDRNT